MKCKYCQAEIDNDSVFCPNCGKKLSEPTGRPQNRPKPKPNYAPKRRETQNNPNNAWWLILMAAVLCIGIYFLFFHSSDGKKKDKDRIEVEEEEVQKAKDDSIYRAKVAMEQQQTQDSLMKVAKAKTDSLTLIKDSLKNVKKGKKDGKHDTNSTARQQTSGSRRSSASVPVIQRDPSLVVGTRNLGYGTFRGTLKNGLPHDVSGRLIFKTAHLIDSRDPKGRFAEPGDYVIGEFSEGHLVQGIWYGPDRQVKGSIIIGK